MIRQAPQPHSEVIVVAHRGCSGDAPENTRASFALALESGAEAVEFDVRLTLDGEAVVFHDRTVNRTTDGRGAVRNLTLARLRSLDAGSWFHRRFKGERIPTLDEALELLKPFRWINIELKIDGASRRSGVLLVQQTVEAVRRTHCEKKVLLSSFHHPLLRYARTLAPHLGSLAITGAFLRRNRMPSVVVRNAGASGFVGSKHDVSAPMLGNAIDSGIPVFIYTLNTERELRRWMKRGVSGVITNFPKRAIEVRENLGMK